MSERLSQSHESARSHEAAHSKELDAQKIEAAKRARHEHADVLEAIRDTIDKETQSAEKSRALKAEQQPTTQHVTRELKAIQYKETMRYVRRHLSPRQRKFSSFIHAPSIEKVSEVGAKTIARPSGLLGGGLIAFVGSISVLYVARQYGFEVPNSLFIALFIVGFGIGLLGEFMLTGFRIRRGKRYSNRTTRL